MAFQKDSGQRSQQGYQSQKFQGDWTCSDCGAKITELPFQPAPDRPIRCADCHRKFRDSNPRR